VDMPRIRGLNWIFSFLFWLWNDCACIVLYGRLLKGHGVASGALFGWDNCICMHGWRTVKGNCKYLCNGNNAYCSLSLLSTTVTIRIIIQLEGRGGYTERQWQLGGLFRQLGQCSFLGRSFTIYCLLDQEIRCDSGWVSSIESLVRQFVSSSPQ
jgi:hypothetical protein